MHSMQLTAQQMHLEELGTIPMKTRECLLNPLILPEYFGDMNVPIFTGIVLKSAISFRSAECLCVLFIFSSLM